MAVFIFPLPLLHPQFATSSFPTSLSLLLSLPLHPLPCAPWHRTTDGDLFACDTVTESKLKETSHRAAN